MKIKFLNMKLSIFILFALFSLQTTFAKTNVTIHPIQHATFFIQYKEMYILIDPAGDLEKLKSYPAPDIILITHTHGDHLNPEMLHKVKDDKTIIIGNRDAVNELGTGIFLINGEKKTIKGINIEAFPMYNITADRVKFHPKGKGNAYILQLGDERVYISGDTEDTKEMRALKNIDHAILCMNLPFTMTPKQAASAVIDFKPKKVYPYHYSQAEGYANINKFKELVNEGCDTEVIFLDWYHKKE